MGTAAGGCHGTHMTTATKQTLDALALQAHQDREHTGAAIDALVNQARTDHADIMALKTQVASIHDVLCQLCDNKTLAPPAAAKPEQQFRFYCWSHGYSNDPKDANKNFPNKKPGHVTTANASNLKGGSKQNLSKYIKFLQE